jgi:hypothetical protein
MSRKQNADNLMQRAIQVPPAELKRRFAPEKQAKAAAQAGQKHSGKSGYPQI